jgi:hypothetical protein
MLHRDNREIVNTYNHLTEPRKREHVQWIEVRARYRASEPSIAPLCQCATRNTLFAKGFRCCCGEIVCCGGSSICTGRDGVYWMCCTRWTGWRWGDERALLAGYFCWRARPTRSRTGRRVALDCAAMNSPLCRRRSICEGRDEVMSRQGRWLVGRIPRPSAVGGKICAQRGMDGCLDLERGPSIRRPHKPFGPTTFSEQR